VEDRRTVERLNGDCRSKGMTGGSHKRIGKLVEMCFIRLVLTGKGEGYCFGVLRLGELFKTAPKKLKLILFIGGAIVHRKKRGEAKKRQGKARGKVKGDKL